MRSVHVLFACSVLGMAGGCRAHPMPHTSWTPRFGPALANELIVGRASAGEDVWLATSLDSIVHVRLAAASYERVSVQGREPGEHLWGLALIDGRLWTLLGRHMLARLTPGGAIAERLPLSAAHVGLFAAGSHLLYQTMDFSPPADALSAGSPGESGRKPWGGIKTRSLPLDRGAVAALNLLSCGSSATGDLPCWFPDEAGLSIVDARGTSRHVELEGLPLVQREVLIASSAPRKPIRDAFVSSSGQIWVIGSGAPRQEDPAARPGGWLLATYTSRGDIDRRLELPEPARLILRADDSSCLLLTWNGSIVEVRL